MKKVIISLLIIFTCVSCASVKPKDVSETGKKISNTFFLSSFINPFAAVISLTGDVLFFSGEIAGHITNQQKTENKEEQKEDKDNMIVY